MQWMKKVSKSLDQYVGESTRKKVMKGSEELKSSSSGKKKAKWMAKAIDKVDELIEEDIRKEVLVNCSHIFPKSRIKPLKSKYKETGSIDAVIKLMHKDTSWQGLSYYEYPKREGHVIYVTKIPCNPVKFDKAANGDEKKFYYCHCRLVKTSLKASEINISSTFCYCGAGWYKSLWEGVLDKPVQVELLQSVIKGDNCCEFAVHLPNS